MKKNSILLIEDNRLLREGISVIVNKQPDMIVCAAIGDGDKVIAVMEKFNPQVVLLDLGLRTQNSLALVKSIRKSFSECKVIVMDLVPLQEDIYEFVQAGVSGFTLKDSGVEDFLRTIRSVLDGVRVLPAYLTDSLFSQILKHANTNIKPNKIEESVRMTKRERQVIELIAEGLSNKEIGSMLHLSTHTIKSHVHNILEKLSLHTRIQIANYSRTTED